MAFHCQLAAYLAVEGHTLKPYFRKKAIQRVRFLGHPVGWHCRLKIVCASKKLCKYSQNWLYNENQLKSEKVLKLSRLSGKFQDSLESFQTVWKGFGHSEQFPDSLDSLESFKLYEKFLNSLECFQTVLKVSGQSGKFQDSVEKFQIVGKVFGQS